MTVKDSSHVTAADVSHATPSLATLRGRSVLQGWVVAVTLAGCALPGLLTRYPPAADLPQHLAQVEQALFRGLAPGTYAAWWATNNLIYAPIAGLHAVVGPEHLASATVGLLGVIWASATAWLGARLRRPAGGIALASALFFNAILSWGMLNFLLGWPLVLVWLATNVPSAADNSRPTVSRAATARAFILQFALGWLLLWAHALCFASACLFAGVLVLKGRSCSADLRVGSDTATPPTSVTPKVGAGLVRRDLVQRLYPALPLIPTALYAMVWVARLGEQRAARGFDTAPHYAISFVDRLDPEYLIAHSVSAGPLTLALFGAILGWVLTGFIRQGVDRRWDLPLASCAALLALAYVALPSKYLNTIEFSSRWLPCMWMLLLLASPGPPVSTRTATLAGGGAVLLASASVSWNWRTFDLKELSGLSEALKATPLQSRVLGLDFLRYSPLIDGRPFLHLSSYATLLRGGSTHFDFSEHGTALIRGAQLNNPWTPGLEWLPERLQPSDLRHFDVALVGAPVEYHEQVIAHMPGFVAMTHSGFWRLYGIETGTSDGSPR